jgi:hypothetical protein
MILAGTHLYMPAPSVQYPSSDEIQNKVFYREGNLYWRTPLGRAVAGRKIGTKTRNGYLIVNWPMATRRHKLLVHRLIWMMFNDTLPPLIDHINRNKEDNRIENLRPLSFTENARNCGNKPRKYDLPRGVTIQKGRYKAQIKLDGKTAHIGIFNTSEEAATAYAQFVAKLRSEGRIEGHPWTSE